MTRLLRSLLFLLILPLSSYAAGVAVRDAGARIEFGQKELTISLPLAEPVGEATRLSVSLQLLSPEDKLVASSATPVTMKPGQRAITAALKDPFHKLALSDLDELYWHRIRYEIKSEGGDVVSSGLVPMSAANGLFRLTLAAGQLARVGRLYQVEVNASTPVTQRPVRGVAVEGQLTWGDESADGGEASLVAHAVTGSDGNARLDFKLPANIADDTMTVKVLGSRGILSRAVEEEVRLYPARIILLDTDKPIYQPGQTLHLRAVVFDSQHKAQDKTDLDAIIRDEEQTVLFRQTMATDAFGIAHTDWAIPSNLRLGDYAIAVRPHDVEDPDPQTAFQGVRIYRYDLPNFSVTVTPDHPYYLPSQNAFVKVAATYLFGQPVPHARVRVVEEKERRWNYREQKWDIEEGQEQIGELDKGGEFTAKLDLTEHHKDLAERTYSLYDNVTFAAYVTDATTGRTEQRSFQLRVTREPIHIYVQNRRLSETLPNDIFVSTSYADGTPARCSVQVSAVNGDEAEQTRHFLRTIKTNKYGLAKIADYVSSEEDEEKGSLLLEAADSKGLKGMHIESLWFPDQETIRVRTPHTIYRQGDPLEVTLQGYGNRGSVLVDVLHDGEVLTSQHVTLRRGRGFVTFPYDPRFTGHVGIVAMALAGANSRYDYPWGSWIVLFPKKRRLSLQVNYDKASYRPGQDGTARFSVKMPDGAGTESALGVKVVDQAVEERARTDQEFGAHFQRWAYLDWEGSGSFAGVTQENLDNLDLSQPVPADLELVAEFMMNSGEGSSLEIGVDGEIGEPAAVFSRLTGNQFKPLQAAGEKAAVAGDLPQDAGDLARIGLAAGIDVPALSDPWGTPYRYELSYADTNQNVKVLSAGPNKRFGDSDDFDAHTLRWKYFVHVGKAIDQVCSEVFQNSGRFIRDRETLQSELKAKGIDLDKLRDPWGSPYDFRFEVDKSLFLIRVLSRGPNPKTEKGKSASDIEVWRSTMDYFLNARTQLDTVLNKYLQSGGRFPEDEKTFRTVLREGGVDLDALRDPWGSQYYVTLTSSAAYSQQVVVTSEAQGERRTSTPVTMVNRTVSVMSAGFDKIPHTQDDFGIASYLALVSEQGAGDVVAKPVETPPSLTGNTGAIRGVVKDITGAVVAGAKVTAMREGSDEEHTEITDVNGRFVFLNLHPGSYSVRASSSGFQEYRIAALPVRSVTLTEVEVVLRLGTTMEMVTVEAAAVRTETDSAMVSTVQFRELATTKGVQVVTKSGVMSTPRLREYFPETMLWEPALVTDRGGHAKLRFKLADNITNWKLSALASTKTGEMGTVEKDLRSFQPFFVEHDPPRVLTEGDEIAYPVVLRNYLDKPQTVQASIKPETWFQILGPAEQKVPVESGDSGRAIFRYRTVASVEAGKQRITAGNAEISDAIEKPIDVHPFGRQDSQSDSTLFAGTTTLHVIVPRNAIPGSLRAELKVYPSLLAHVVESIEAVLERPYGCAEQAISSTYPSLLVVKFYKQRGGEAPPVVARAKRYLQSGYERLLRYQDASGGFTYWGHGEPDIALTAYALEFLTDAGDLIEVDPAVVERAGDWLKHAQQKDGSWHSAWQKTDAAIMETAHIVQVLAALPASKDKDRDATLKKGLQFLAEHRGMILEPYAIANYALAARASGDKATAEGLVQELRSSAHPEGDAVYWDLQTNTPFYCWGRPGRLESTALAMRTLGQSAADQDLVHRGFLFLLRNQDRYGIWYSGHTTVNVLQTMMSAIAGRTESKSSSLQVLVNGKVATTVTLPPGDVAGALQRSDLSSYVAAGANEIELRSDGGAAMSAQAVMTYYMPWTEPAAAKGEPALRMRVQYSKTDAKENDTIECRVKAERVGFQGYGMMLAEIGLPPGVDVDRESLEAAASGDWAVDQYDVLPDRVVLYLWPRAGGTEFTFKFRLRFGMSAETAASVIYDYYNPDAAVTVAPVKFEVQSSAR